MKKFTLHRVCEWWCLFCAALEIINLDPLKTLLRWLQLALIRRAPSPSALHVQIPTPGRDVLPVFIDSVAVVRGMPFVYLLHSSEHASLAP